MKKHIFVLGIFCAVFQTVQCSEVCEEKLQNCTAIMQPVLNEVRYMFPTSQMEIDGMCKIWNHIMDCVRKYVADCSTEEQRNKFNEAVSNSIDSVHAICYSERYKIDYLEYASCFRKVSMDSCGHHFKRMVDSAYDRHSPETHICCAYRKFEKCVSDPIQRMCGPQALHILDDSMSSLRSRCDTITQSLKPTDKMCPADMSDQSNERSQPRPALRHVDPTYSPLTPTGYFINGRTMPSWTSPVWTQRTVIYPLPTRHSRIYRRSGSCTILSSAYSLTTTFLALTMAWFL